MKKFFLASLALSPLYLSTQVIHAEKFTLAIMGDPQYKWSCSDEGKDNAALSDYCNSVKGKSGINEPKDSNEKAIKAIKQLRDTASTPFKGLIINGDLTSFGHEKERKYFHQKYTIHNPKSDDLVIYPGLGNHDYQNNINDCGAKSWVDWNHCAGGMMHLMADWILGYKGLDKGKPHGCNPLLKSCDIYAFNKNPAQIGGNRNVIGSLAYSWEIDKFLFIQLQNYPHYTTNFKRGYAVGVSSWTMKAENSMDWLISQLKEAKANNKYVILNLHNIAYYFANTDNSRKDKAELEKVLNDYSPNIKAIFVGHLHQKIGEYNSLGGVKIIYSGAPIAGRFLKVEFDSAETDKCITVTPSMTVEGTPLNPKNLNPFTIKCEPLPEPTPAT